MSALTRTALITGASSGIGAAIARKLLAEGHRVVGLARRFDDSTLASRNFHPIEIDLSALVQLPAKLEELSRLFPALDAAVLCAGRGQFGSLEEFSYAQISALMELNFTSQAYVARALLPRFKRQARGDLIFIGSEAALKGGRRGAVYSASKFALRGFAQALREECSRSGVRVSVINPGMVKTAFYDALNFSPGSEERHHLIPDDIAELVSLVLRLRVGTVVDEINLSPLNRVIRSKG
jgi:3-hydroxy acid dehydrogenase/malonic semialdehyde reductase